MPKIRAIIDMNVLRKTLRRTNEEFFIYEAFESELFDWVVSTEILNEYEEKLIEFYSVRTANLVLEILCNANNAIFAEPFYRWNIIAEDPDDNKYVDLAIATNVDCIVTFDKHNDILKKIDFPKVTVLKPKQFMAMLRKNKIKEG
jgi:uncharacterized protein